MDSARAYVSIQVWTFQNKQSAFTITDSSDELNIPHCVSSTCQTYTVALHKTRLFSAEHLTHLDSPIHPHHHLCLVLHTWEKQSSAGLSRDGDIMTKKWLILQGVCGFLRETCCITTLQQQVIISFFPLFLCSVIIHFPLPVGFVYFASFSVFLPPSSLICVLFVFHLFINHVLSVYANRLYFVYIEPFQF